MHPQLQEPTLSACEMESLLRELTNPDEANAMHVSRPPSGHRLLHPTHSTRYFRRFSIDLLPISNQAAALRQQLRDLMETTEQYDYQTDSQPPQVELLKRTHPIPRTLRYGKRNIGALARQGLLRGVDLDELDEVRANQKRSLATLAKNGQLPSAAAPDATAGGGDDDTEVDGGVVGGDDGGSTPPLMQQWKRNMAAMARAGLIGRSSQADYSAEAKRSLSSLARSNGYPYGAGGETNKRNVGALARDWTLPTTQSNRLNGAFAADTQPPAY